MFSGLLYCADCGEKLYYSVTNNYKREQAGKRYQLMDIYYNGVGVIRGLTPEEMEEAFQEHLAKRKINKAKTA